MIKSIIVAQSKNRVIGHKGKLPWHLPADLAHFKKTTYGHPIIMGRSTFESIGRPLPGRMNIILTKQNRYLVPAACKVVHDLEAAFFYAQDHATQEVFVIGGAQVYEQALSLVDKIYMTQVHAHIEGDRFFPVLDAKKWEEESRLDLEPDSKNPYAYAFVTYLSKSN